MSNTIARISTLAAVGLLCAVAADAQTDNRLALGGSVTSRVAGSSDTDASTDVGFDLRLGHEKEGWGWSYSFFSWFDTGLGAQPTITTGEKLGQLRVRPVLLGYGYTWIRGKTSVTAELLGGFAFNSFHLDPAAMADYGRRGATNIDTEATNTLALRPGVQIWYDLSPKIGLKLTGGYLIARPSITVKSSLGNDTRDVKADTVLITFGIVYSIL